MLAASLVLPDSRIPCQDKIAGVQRCFLEVLRIGWKKYHPGFHM